MRHAVNIASAFSKFFCCLCQEFYSVYYIFFENFLVAGYMKRLVSQKENSIDADEKLYFHCMHKSNIVSTIVW